MTFGTQELRHGSSPPLPPGGLFLGGGGGFLYIYNDIPILRQLIIKCDKKIKQPFFISTLREPSVNRKDFQALTRVGPLRYNPKSDPLVALHLDKRL